MDTPDDRAMLEKEWADADFVPATPEDFKDPSQARIGTLFPPGAPEAPAPAQPPSAPYAEPMPSASAPEPMPAPIPESAPAAPPAPELMPVVAAPEPAPAPAPADGAPTTFAALLDEMLSTDLKGVQVADYREEGKTMSAPALANEYRSMAELNTALNQAQIKRANAPLEDRLARMEKALSALDPLRAQADDLAAQKAEALMLGEVERLGLKGAGEIVSDAGFWSWMKDQAPGLQTLAQSTDPRDVHFLMKSYQLQKGASPAQAERAASSAAAAEAQARDRLLHGGSMRPSGQFPRAPQGEGAPSREELQKEWNDE